MKNIDQPKIELILPDDPGLGVTREKFAKLIRAEDLRKIEVALELPTPTEGFRDRLISVLWAFYINNLPKAKVKVSRAALKKELRLAAKLSRDLEESAARIWSFGDCTVVTELSEFGEWHAWQSSRPMHPSGIAWVALLDEFATRTSWLADALPDDGGGPRQAQAFDHLLISLSDYYRSLMRDSQQSIEGPDYFRFAAAVKDMLLGMSKHLPNLNNGVPISDVALGKRLYRLNAKRRQAQSRT
jgi:hypothetical protein